MFVVASDGGNAADECLDVKPQMQQNPLLGALLASIGGARGFEPAYNALITVLSAVELLLIGHYFFSSRIA